MTEPSPAIQLILQAIRTRYGAATPDHLAETASRITDWAAVFRAAHVHAVTPLMHEALTQGPAADVIPVEAREELEDRAQANRLRNLQLSGELAHLLERFRIDGIPAVPYKGPVLAAQAYGDVALREFVDLDILVHRENVERARALLQSGGYRVSDAVTPRRWRHILRHGHDLKLTRDDRAVEIQWAVIDRAYGARPDVAAMLERAATTEVAGRTMPTLAPEDLLLTLCVHGGVHLWERLAWSCDVAELLRAAPGMDLGVLGRRAADVGARRALLLGVDMAARITGCDSPPRLADATAADPIVGRLADELAPMTLDRMGEDAHHDDTPAGPYFRLLLAMSDTRADRRRQLLRLIAIPTASDWINWPLPDWAFPAYYLERPARLTWSYAARDRRPGDVHED